MQNRVFVLDANKQPLMPCHPARARKLLRQKKAAVYRHAPFTLILKHRKGGEVQPLRWKIDPGAKTTGMALVASFARGDRCVFAMELTHRGATIKKDVKQRRNCRRNRRSRNLRHRKPRFQNRRRRKGWLPPSLQSRVDNVVSWTRRTCRHAPVTQLSMEHNRFDTQKLQNPEIEGVEYQQGTLFGYEVKEYLLQKWKWKCAYCGRGSRPLEVEHIIPTSRGGSDRVSNLTLACRKCNLQKGNQTAEEYGYSRIQAEAKKPLRAAAILNATRNALTRELESLGLGLEVGSGGQTKFNRKQQGYEKQHWLDAVCVGHSGAQVFVEKNREVLEVRAMGRGNRQMCRVNKYGFPRSQAKSGGEVQGFRTGDLVKAVITKGKKKGVYVGRVAVRKSGRFNIKTKGGTVQGIGYKNCKNLQKQDGYFYSTRTGVSSPGFKAGVSTPPNIQGKI